MTTLSSAAAKLAAILARHVDSQRGLTNVFVESVCRMGAELISPWFDRRRRRRPQRQRGRSADAAEKGSADKKKKEGIFFRGVFCADKIPPSLVRDAAKGGSHLPYTLIINLARAPSPPSSSYSPEESFVLVQSDDDADAELEAILRSEEDLEGHFVFIEVTDMATTYFDPFGTICGQEDVRAFLRDLSRLPRRRGLPLRQNRQAIQSPFSVACGLYAVLFVLAAEVDVPRSYFRWRTTRLADNDRICAGYIRDLLALWQSKKGKSAIKEEK